MCECCEFAGTRGIGLGDNHYALLATTPVAYPLTAGPDLDDPATTELRKRLLRLLRAIYDEWYRKLARELPAVEGAILELGSGAGYRQRYIPALITSEFFFCDNHSTTYATPPSWTKLKNQF